MEQKSRDINKIIVGSSIGQFNTFAYYLMLLERRNAASVPHFFISRDGIIHKLTQKQDVSDYTTIKEYDENSISIELENVGYLELNEKNEYIDSFGTIYRGEVYQKPFRGKKYWQPYTEEQKITLNNLIGILSEEFDLEFNDLTTLNYNPNSDVLFRTNISLMFSDMNHSILTDGRKYDKKNVSDD